MNRRMSLYAMAAVFCWLAAAVGFGAMLDGYSQARHPLGLLGGKDIPNAHAFNVLGFFVPAVLAAMAISSLRARLSLAAGWGMRIGVQLLVMSAVAFAVQGLLPLDPSDLDAPTTRYHAVAWTLWWIAFVSGALMLGWSMRRHRQWRTLVGVSVLAVAVVSTFAWLAPGTLPAGIVERIAFATWFGWMLLATRSISASVPSPAP